MTLKLFLRNADESRSTVVAPPASAPVCTNISPVLGTDNAEYLRLDRPLASDTSVIPQPPEKPSPSVWIRRFRVVTGFTLSGTNANLVTTSSTSLPSDGGLPPIQPEVNMHFLSIRGRNLATS